MALQSHQRREPVQSEAGDACSENVMEEPDEEDGTWLRDAVPTDPTDGAGACADPSGDSACLGRRPVKVTGNRDR